MSTTTPQQLDVLVRDMVFGTDAAAKQAKLREMAYAGGLYFASIQNLYDAMGKKYGGFTVPAVNVRGVTFDFARAMFRSAIVTARQPSLACFPLSRFSGCGSRRAVRRHSAGRLWAARNS